MNNLTLLLVSIIAYPFASFALSASSELPSNVVYLSIVSTETEKLDFIKKYALLKGKFEGLKIISSNDCSNLKAGLVLITSAISNKKDEIDAALINAKTKVPDSYQRECKVKPGSMLSYNLSFIHESILTLPADTISWSFDDAKSEIRSLDNENIFLMKRTYAGNIDDEVEGRGASLLLVNTKNHQQKTILEQCWDFEKPAKLNTMITFQCVTGMAGNQFIHSVYVFDVNKNKILLEKKYCKNPVFSNKNSIGCDEESVNEFGELKLEKNNYKIIN